MAKRASDRIWESNYLVTMRETNTTSNNLPVVVGFGPTERGKLHIKESRGYGCVVPRRRYGKRFRLHRARRSRRPAWLAPQSVGRGHGTSGGTKQSGGEKSAGRHPHFSNMSPSFRRVAISISIHFRAQPIRSRDPVRNHSALPKMRCSTCSEFEGRTRPSARVRGDRPARRGGEEIMANETETSTRRRSLQPSTGTASAFHKHFLFRFLIPTEKRPETDAHCANGAAFSLPIAMRLHPALPSCRAPSAQRLRKYVE